MGPLSAVAQPVHLRHRVASDEDVGAVRRELHRYCLARDVPAVVLARAELAVTEIATNILYHAAGNGWVLFRVIQTAAAVIVEVIGVDQGPGIANLAHVLAEGARRDGGELRAGTGRPAGLGVGLGTVRRLASTFDIWSRPGDGTVLCARFHAGAAEMERGCRIGGVSIALDGFGLDNGDGWATAESNGARTAIVVDGLGHGRDAKAAADAALAVFERQYTGDLLEYLPIAHDAMRATRGGAIGGVRIDPLRRKAYFVGVGNVEGRIYLRNRTQGLTSRNGTLGMNVAPPSSKLLEYVWEPPAVVVLHSDGIRLRLEPERMRDLATHDPTVAAAVIHRDCARVHDDATVVVVTDPGGG